MFFKEYKHGNLSEKWAAFLFMGNLICRDAVQGLFSAKIAQKNVQLPLIKEKKIHLVVIRVKQKSMEVSEWTKLENQAEKGFKPRNVFWQN